MSDGSAVVPTCTLLTGFFLRCIFLPSHDKPVLSAYPHPALRTPRTLVNYACREPGWGQFRDYSVTWPDNFLLSHPSLHSVLYRLLLLQIISIIFFSRGNSVDIATRLQAERQRTLVWFPTKMTDIFLLCKVPSLAFWCSQCPTHGILIALSSEVRRPVHGANHSLPSGAKIESVWSYISSRLCTFMA